MYIVKAKADEYERPAVQYADRGRPPKKGNFVKLQAGDRRLWLPLLVQVDAKAEAVSPTG